MTALIIEDRPSFGPVLVRQLEPLGVAARWVPHCNALQVAGELYAGVNLVVLDAFDLDSQQSDPTRSRLTSLDVLDAIGRVAPGKRPEVVCYSTAMARPEVNIALRCPGVAAAFYEVVRLSDSLSAVVSGRYPNQVDTPGPQDWAALDPDLPVDADVAAAHQKIREHPRAWRQIWDPDALFDKTAQMWIARNVLPLLSLSASDGYGIARNVIRKIAGLPYRLA